MNKILWKILRRLKHSLDEFNEINKNTSISPGVYLKGVKISSGAVINEGCRLFNVTIKGKVELGRYTSVWGPNTYVMAKVNSIKIGSFCSIARNVTLQEYNHNYHKASTYYIGANIFEEDWSNEIVSKGDIIIGNDVWIGSHCVILSGARIGNGAIVAANSLVNGIVPDYAIVGGTPAKVLRYRFDDETIKHLSALKWWDWDIEKIKRNKALFKNEYKAGEYNPI